MADSGPNRAAKRNFMGKFTNLKFTKFLDSYQQRMQENGSIRAGRRDRSRQAFRGLHWPAKVTGQTERSN